MGMGGIIDVLFLASGVYLIWTAISAKRQRNIVANVMLGKDVNEDHIKDKVGFIEYMYKRILLSGVLIVMGSAVHLVNDYYIFSNSLTWVGIMLVFIALVIYISAYMSGQKRYIGNTNGSRQKRTHK